MENVLSWRKTANKMATIKTQLKNRKSKRKLMFNIVQKTQSKFSKKQSKVFFFIFIFILPHDKKTVHSN